MSPPSSVRVLGINGSLRGASGTSAAVLRHALDRAAAAGHETRRVDLATWGASPEHSIEAMVALVEAADALLVATGTYWGGPSSLLQRWLEVLTFTEGGPAWRGKAAGVVVTMHSVGGLEVAQRLAATLALLGATIPAAGLVVLADAQAAAAVAAPDADTPDADTPDADTWVLGDVDTLVHNVLAVAALRPTLGGALRHWPVDAYPALRGPWPATGALWHEPPRGAGAIA
jgi:NAD(P)H-dependent FMN reductase